MTVTGAGLCMGSGSVRAPAAQHGGDRSQEDPHVETERPVVDVLHVALDPVFELRFPADHLPEAGDAGLDAEATPVGARLDPADVAQRQGPGTDQAHVAADDVEELWELVEAQAADQASDARHARVVADLEDWTAGLVERLEP